MTSLARLALTLLCVLSLALQSASAQEPQSGGRIAWSKDLPTALEQAKQTERVVMVCINARRVDGRRDDEPAAKGLRDVVYRDARIVERSRDFVCVLLTAEGTSSEYDALRALGIDGDIISPQHVFIAPEGDRIVHRKEYWRHGQGEPAVEALLAMMQEAQAAAGRAPAVPPDASGAPADGEARAAWIAERVALVAADVEARDRALAELALADKDGDCTDPLIALLPEYEKNPSTLRALIRTLGKDGLEAAALPLTERLDHKEMTVRANAAVSLEYIGSADKKVVAALKKAAKKEKDEGVANHMYRALGRCGLADSKIRSLLLDEALGAKSEFASYGPLIGLAYFDEDEKARRGVEEIMSRIGLPGGRRGGGQNAIKRAIASWTLASIGDAKSARFVREDFIEPLDNMTAFWVEGLRRFWESTARACDGEEGALAEVEAGVAVIAGFARGGFQRDGGGGAGGDGPVLDDEARRERPKGDFEPQGDGLLGEDG